MNDARIGVDVQEKRRKYDQFGHQPFDNMGAGSSSGFDFSNFDFGDIFDDLFGESFGFTGRKSSTRGRRGNDISLSMKITFEEAAYGCEKEIEIEHYVNCEECDGKGGLGEETCKYCHGSGTITQEQRTILGTYMTRTTCPYCKGKGTSYKEECSKCKGKGVVKEKGIKKEAILESIETALVTAYKRNFDSEENVKVTMDGQTGEIHIYAVKDVVEEVENPNTQILLSDAKNIDSKLLVGDKAEIELMPKNFGRIAAQTAKQIIVQKIREESRNLVFDEFNERKGEIVSGIVQKADGNIVVLDLGKLEAVMPAKEQVPTEHYHVNDKIRAYIMNVEKGLKGAPQVTVSRACSDFVRKLFELEIPEIYEGVIEIKSVSRDAGNRSKVAVYSPNENIDPVGSCVGQKGIRIQNIINELHGEKIDVIEWNQDPAIYISAALLPAQVMAVDAHEDEKFAQVIVPDDQLSLAIGKAGQNARLAARLTGWKIDIKSETQFREMLSKQQEESDEETKTEE